MAFGAFAVAACADGTAPNVAGPVADASRQSMAAANIASIVVFKDDVADAPGLARELTRAYGVSPRFTYSAAIKGFAAVLPQAALDALARNPNVAYVERDVVATASASGTRTLTSAQWGLDRIDQQATATRGLKYAFQTEGE